jgi:SAM-dependent methyltransferase
VPSPWSRPFSREAARRFLGRHLRGHGLEVGPGHLPYPLPPNARVRYVDRWRPDENRERFPELGAAAFPAPDVVANFDVDRLAPIADESCDFVICSHVIEHLADPIAFLGDINRVLRLGGVALLLVPDRRRTFDAGRSATPLAHLIADHQAGITEVDDEHMLDFLSKAGPEASYLGVPEEPAVRAHWFRWHRERSIHVHCWSEDEFPDVIAYGVRALGHAWELVDAVATDAQGSTGAEFGYVLRRATPAAPAGTWADRFVNDWRSWRHSGRPVFTRPPVVVQSRAVLVIDAPQPGADVGQRFLVGGWAVDDRPGIESGIDMVEVWAVAANGDEVFIDVVPTGGLRPDTIRAVGERGRRSGYTLEVMGLSPGVYDMIVRGHSAVRDAFVAGDRRRITVARSSSPLTV